MFVCWRIQFRLHTSWLARPVARRCLLMSQESSLFFIGVLGLRPDQYGLIFSACSAAVMSGAQLDGRLGRHGISSGQVMTIGLALPAAAAAMLLGMTLAGWTSPIL